MRPLPEQTILVTGSTDGLGKLTALRLAQMGATVLLHGRSRTKCRAVCEELVNATGNAKTTYYVADFSSLAQVRDLAEAVRAGHPRLDVLINNAGVGPGQTSESNRALSQDGHELLFAVNYLAPFLLTLLLLPVLQASAPSRIVNVSSAAQRAIDLTDAMPSAGFKPMRAYAQSKLALAIFTFELARRLRKEETTVNCLHPGSLLDTKMVREAFSAPQGRAEDGAEVEVQVATSPDLAGITGRYFYEKQESRAAEQAYDAQAREQLWRLSLEWVGLQDDTGLS